MLSKEFSFSEILKGKIIFHLLLPDYRKTKKFDSNGLVSRVDFSLENNLNALIGLKLT